MRHRRTTNKLGAHRSHRRALIKNLMRSFILDGSIQTTETKAKAVKSEIEKLVTTAKKNSLDARRKIIQKTGSKTAAQKMLSEIAPQYAERTGGYCRITKIKDRPGDGSKIVLLSFV